MGSTPITTEFVIFVIAVIGAIAGAWFRFEARIEKARAETADNKADLARYKLHVAETYITKEGMREQMGSVLSGINDLKNITEIINQRIDRLFDADRAADMAERRNRS